METNIKTENMEKTTTLSVYVQVPVTGRPWAEALREADARCRAVEAAGHVAVNPLRLVHNEANGADGANEAPETMAPTREATARAMGRCVEALLGCDALLLHPAAADTNEDPKEIRYSRGCRTEALAAITYGLRVLTLSDEGALREDATRYERFRVVTKSLAMAEDSILCIADLGEYSSSFVYGKYIDLVSAIVNEMESKKHLRKLMDMAQEMRKVFGDKANGADEANEANEANE